MKSLPEIYSTFQPGIKINKCKLSKGKHPLKQFKFYLDIHSSGIFKKVEQQIKELGGSLEFFLSKEITHFITDKVYEHADIKLNLSQTYYSDTKNSPNFATNPSSTAINSPSNINEIKVTSKAKSRADAMLNRARQGTNDCSKDNIASIAKELGTSVWHTTYALRFFQKVFSENSSHIKKANIQPNDKVSIELKNHYIKLESIQTSNRPFYHVFNQADFPNFRIKHTRSNVLFELPSIKHNLKEVNIRKKSDISKADMTRKSRSSKNLKRNSKPNTSEKQCGFCEICKVEYDVLKIHLKTEEHGCFVKNETNFLVLDSLINSSANVDNFLGENNTKMSLIKSDSNMEREFIMQNNNKKSSRQTRQTSTRHNSSRNKNAIKSGKDPTDNIEDNGTQTSNSNFCKSGINKLSKIICTTIKDNVLNDSPPIRHSIPTSLIYKVIQSKENPALSKKVEEILTDQNSTQTPSLIVKFKKIRQTELTVLNGEAENFMYPKKLSSEVTDLDRQTTSENCRLSSSSILSTEDIQQKYNLFDNGDLTETKKLRKTNSRITINKRDEETNKELLANSFAFERIPIHESWFNAFQRQDDTKEHFFEYYGDTGYRKLPFEIGAIEISNSNLCQICPKSEFIPDLKNETADEQKSELLLTSKKIKKETVESRIAPANEHHTRRYTHETDSILKRAFLNFETPRKSPREHASTLAILSCLINQNNEKTKFKKKFLNETVSSKDEKVECIPDSKHISTHLIKDSLVKEVNLDDSDDNLSKNVDGMMQSSSTAIPPALAGSRRSQKCHSVTINSGEEFMTAIQKQKQIESFFRECCEDLTIDDLECNILESTGYEYEKSFANQLSLTDIIDDNRLTSLTQNNNNGNNQFNKYRFINIFSVNKKRKNNKTGWPNKRRITNSQRRCKPVSIASPNNDFLELSYNKEGCYDNYFMKNRNKLNNDPQISPVCIDDKTPKNYNDYIANKKLSANHLYSNINISENFTVSSDSLDTFDLDERTQAGDEKNLTNLCTNNDTIKKSTNCKLRNTFKHNFHSTHKKQLINISKNIETNKINNEHSEDDAVTTPIRKLRKHRGSLPRHR